MNDEQKEQMNRTDAVTPANLRNVWIWAITLIVIFVVAALITTIVLYKDKVEAVERHRDRMNSEIGEGGSQPPSSVPPEGTNQVTTGIYVDRIISLSIKKTGWTVDFYVWFRWKGAGADPGEKLQVVDGSIESKEKVEEYTRGSERYVLYRVVARITKFFDVSRFPRDDHVLTISLESHASERRELLFVADQESSGISSRVQIPGYSIYRHAVIEKPHAYVSNHGDPRLAGGMEKVQSQLRIGIWIHRWGWGFYLKMFVALFAAVGVALIAFFIKPSDVDPRFGLGIGALGAVIVNTYVTSTLVPDTGVLTLADLVNHVAIVTITLSLMQSAISLYLYERRGKKELSRFFDTVSFPVFLVGYVIVNLSLPISATLWVAAG